MCSLLNIKNFHLDNGKQVRTLGITTLIQHCFQWSDGVIRQGKEIKWKKNWKGKNEIVTIHKWHSICIWEIERNLQNVKSLNEFATITETKSIFYFKINGGLPDLRHDGINVPFCVPSTKIFFKKNNKLLNF